MIYEWEGKKAIANLRKHGISFDEAASVFLDASALTYPDPDHSTDEEREITIGISLRGRILFIAHCPRGDRIRIISARKATKREQTQYEKEQD